MKYENVYFITGSGYAGKSTLVKRLAERHGGIACEENYHDQLLDTIDKTQFPYLSYTIDLEDWHDFIRRTPDEYEAWITGVSKECETLELRILEDLLATGKKVFVDTNISLETLHRISDERHVLVMLADPEISVRRFFEREDREKQFSVPVDHGRAGSSQGARKLPALPRTDQFEGKLRTVSQQRLPGSSARREPVAGRNSGAGGGNLPPVIGTKLHMQNAKDAI